MSDLARQYGLSRKTVRSCFLSLHSTDHVAALWVKEHMHAMLANLDHAQLITLLEVQLTESLTCSSG